jgi:hypothetical protein
MSNFLPGYDDWKTTDPADNPKPKKPERDPDLGRENQIERQNQKWEDQGEGQDE